jgi:Mechanosensitive ion channel
MTRELATVPNGAIARCRIINVNRSGGAQLMIHVKFEVDVSLPKIELFKSAVQKFIEERPQEFCRTVGFRLTRVDVDLDFVEYVVVVQSRRSWAESTAVLESKKKVASFCLKVQKKLDMRYTSRPMQFNMSVEHARFLDTLKMRDSSDGVRP